MTNKDLLTRKIFLKKQYIEIVTESINGLQFELDKTKSEIEALETELTIDLGADQ